MNILDKMALLRRQLIETDLALREIMKDLENEVGGAGYNLPPVRTIQGVVCEHFHLPIGVMRSNLRPDDIVRPRMIAMSIACELTTFGQRELAQCFDKKCHSAIVYAHTRVKGWVETDSDFAATYQLLLGVSRARLKGMDMPLLSKAS